MEENHKHEIQRIKQLMLQTALEWDGAQPGCRGTSSRQEWVAKIDTIAEIESPEDAVELLEAEDIDPGDWFIENQIDLVKAGMPPDDIDWSVIKHLGEEIARQSWRGGSWVSVYDYGGVYFVSNEVETTWFESLDEALESAGIGNETHDSIMDLSTNYPATKAISRGAQDAPPQAEGNEQPGRPAIIVVTEWPSGTAAIRFGQALQKSLRVEKEAMTLVCAGHERIYRAITPVCKEEFEESMAKHGARWSDRAVFIAL